MLARKLTSYIRCRAVFKGGGGGGGAFAPPCVILVPPPASVGCSTPYKLPPPPLFCPYPKFAPPWKLHTALRWVHMGRAGSRLGKGLISLLDGGGGLNSPPNCLTLALISCSNVRSPKEMPIILEILLGALQVVSYYKV